MARPAPSDMIARYAADLEDAASDAELLAALEDLEASASRLRRLIGDALRAGRSYREIAKASGLPVGTVQRWRYEVPPSSTLRAATHRREHR